MKPQGGDGDGGEFEESLAALKRDGCAFLVVGDVPPAVHSGAAEQFLGERDDGRCLVVVTDDACRPGPTAGTDPSVVRYRGAVRNAADATTASPDGTDAVADDLHELGVAVHGELEAYEATNPDPSPGGFRVVVLSAATLVADGGERRLFSWLHLLVSRVRAARGMGFVHLAVDRSEPPVPTLRPLFDGVVELRTDCNRSRQRWHLEDTSSDWFDL